MTNWNSKDWTQFKIRFEQELESLLYSQEVVNEDFHHTADDLLDDMDFTSAEMEQSMRRRLRNREALYTKKIQDALERIQAGTFGLCESCEDPIELKRLEARPTTSHCLGCKEHQELREFHHADGRKHKSMGVKTNLRILA